MRDWKGVGLEEWKIGRCRIERCRIESVGLEVCRAWCWLLTAAGDPKVIIVPVCSRTQAGTMVTSRSAGTDWSGITVQQTLCHNLARIVAFRRNVQPN